MRKQLLLLAAAIPACVLLTSCASDSNQQVTDLLAKSDQGWSQLPDYERGKHELEIGNFGLAIEAFDAELGRDPNSIRALNGEAVAYDRIGRRDVAEQLFQKALALDANSAETLSNLAFLHLRYGEVARAEDLAARARAVLAQQAGTPAVVARVLNANEALMAQQSAPRPVAAAAPPVALEKTGANTWSLDISKAPLVFAPISPVADQMPAATSHADVEALQTAPVSVAPMAAPVLRTAAPQLAGIADRVPAVDLAEQTFAPQPSMEDATLTTSAPHLAMGAPPALALDADIVLPAPQPIEPVALTTSAQHLAMAAPPTLDLDADIAMPAPQPIEPVALTTSAQHLAMAAPPALALDADIVLPAPQPIEIAALTTSAPGLTAAAPPTLDLAADFVPPPPRPIAGQVFTSAGRLSLAAPPTLDLAADFIVPAPQPIQHVALTTAAPHLTLAAPSVALDDDVTPAPGVDVDEDPVPRELAKPVVVTPLAPQLVAEIAAEQPVPMMPVAVLAKSARFGQARHHSTIARKKAAAASSAAKLQQLDSLARQSVMAVATPLRHVASAPARKVASVRPARLQIANASGREGLAARLGEYLAGRGEPIGRIDAASYNTHRTVLFYHGGSESRAARLAALLPLRPALVKLKSTSDAIEIVLGADFGRIGEWRVKLTER
ncbi:MAG: LytR C-terminal domain-containing protein [Alphaproteobacteria bacterium]|nr:LytR C-terminal domain-containing protein [Alphaproteobacteria bacterium]